MKQKIKLSLFTSLLVLVLTSSCTKNEVTSITLSNTTENFTLAQTDSLIATIAVTGDINKFPVAWSTSNPNVVSVAKGRIEGVSVGKATITAKAGGMTATCDVNVSNEIYPVLQEGFLLNLGDVINPGVSNLLEVAIAGPNDTLYVFVNASITATNTLPVGDYKLLTSISNYSDIVPFTIIPGQLSNGIQYNSWYIGIIESPITNGVFKVTSLKNNTYTIEIDFIDGYGNIIYENYQGTLTYYDDSTSAVAPSLMKNPLKNRTPKFFNNLIKLKRKDFNHLY